MYQFFYGTTECNGIKSNNWKKMHGIPLKAKCQASLNGQVLGTTVVIPLDEYVSKRSIKKRKKYRFRHSWNILKAIELQNNPELKRIYNRYGYSRKKMKRKLRRLQ